MKDPQYDKALLLSDKMRDKVGSNGFSTTGHSLGGGLASAASASTGAKGTTFNAAGLHEKTTERIGLPNSERDKNQQNVDSYQNSSCPLSIAQNNREGVLWGLGKAAGKAAGAVGSFFGGPIVGAIGNVLGEGAVKKLASDGALPKAYGNKIVVPSESFPGTGHGIGEMIELLDKQTKDDLEKLKKQFNCP